MDDEFYDSLDEEIYYESTDKSHCENTNRTINSLKTRLADNKVNKLSVITTHDSEFIPYFDRGVAKSDIQLQMRAKANYKARQNFHPKSNKRYESFTKPKATNSYLKIFQSKIGKDNEITLDVLSSASTATTAVNGVPHLDFVSCEDLENFTKKSLISETDTELNTFNLNSPYDRNSRNLFTQRSSSLSMASSLYNLQSISQVGCNMDDSYNLNKRLLNSRRNISRSQAGLTSPSTLGGLGPNIPVDKLEIFRKKQLYGKTVSSRNMIKIMEQKALQNIEKEINNCVKKRQAVSNS